MNPWSLLLIYVGCLLFAAPAAAVDLTKIDRTIAKEPKYQAKPKYCLLVFGPEAKTRVWLVLDGDVLYVDRNGNGDLSEEGEQLVRFRITKRPEPDNPVAEIREFIDLKTVNGKKTREASFLNGTDRYSHFYLEQRLVKARFQPQSEQAKKEHDRYAAGNFVRIVLGVKPSLGQEAIAYLGDRPREAPIIHFDGPLTFRFHSNFGGSLVRGEKDTEVFAELFTCGLGREAITRLESAGVPAALHPIAEIEYPVKEAEGRRLRTKLMFTSRC